MSRTRYVVLFAAGLIAATAVLLGARADPPAPTAGPRLSTLAPGASTTPTPAGTSADSPLNPLLGAAAATAPDPEAVPAGCPTPAAAALTRAPGSGRTVALTFDDGPGEYTSQVLEVLRAERVHATFFVIGDQVGGWPQVVARTAAEGHLLGDHSWSHRYPAQVPGGWTARYLRGELQPARAAISRVTGQPVCWFRPPGGEQPPAMLPTARALGFSVALWSIDPKDWRLQGLRTTTPVRPVDELADLIVDRVRSGLGKPHPVILLHDGGGYRGAGVVALTRIIEEYRARGYRFVRLDGRS